MHEPPRFLGRRRRPPWWPHDEHWPPSASAWQTMHRRFLQRIAVLLLTLFGLIFGAMLLGFFVFDGGGGPDHRWNGWDGPPIFGFLVLLGGAFLVIRLLRRTTAPMGDFMQAIGRLAAGDHSARVRPQGSQEVRELANAFNALAERLDKNETQRRDLIADVTHELRTPLSVIRGTAEGIVDGVYPGDLAHVGPIVDEADLMARLLEDLATLSRVEAGQLILHFEEMRPHDLIEESLGAFRARFEESGVALGNSVPDDLPTLNVDPVRIRQVLSNILANALRYTARGGSVMVEATFAQAEGAVVFRVIDTGTGISADELPYVFERFRKADESDGSGLGLSIARSLIEAHGGRIWAESRAGRGTTVIFSLPLAMT